MKKTLTLILAILLTSIANKTKAFAEIFTSLEAFNAFCERTAQNTGYSVQRIKDFLVTTLNPETLEFVSQQTGISVARLQEMRDEATRNGITVFLTNAPSVTLSTSEMIETGNTILRSMQKTGELTKEYVEKQAVVVAKHAPKIEVWAVQSYYASLEAQNASPVFGTKKTVNAN